MRRVTVRWHARAEDDLARLWLDSPDPAQLERAANEIDALLSVNPASKGRGGALARLDEETSRLLLERSIVLPEDLRWVRCGPLELYFLPREDDCLALVYLVQLRSDRP
jgi:hypothetical protein